MVRTRTRDVGVRMHTLGLLEGALVDTRLQGLVEERIEHVVADIGEVVVGLDILLEGLTAGWRVSDMFVLR